MAEQEQDKSEKATPFKLQEARRRGQVARSMDLNSFVLIGGALALLTVWGARFIREGASLARAIFDQAPQLRFDIPDLMTWFASLAVAVTHMMAPFFIMIVVLAVLSNLVQTGPVFSFFPLKPDPKRLSPIAGFKRIFSIRIVFETIKTLFKLGLFGTIAYFVVVGMFPAIISMLQMDPKAYPAMLLDSVSSLIFKLVLALLFVAVLDLIYTRWDFGKKMRMSRREMKEEVKRREGDPLIRAKIKELQRENAKRAKSAQRVPDADVLITNPTHFAVALKYERGTAKAPRVIAKGVGDMALHMRALASRHGVPVLERPTLARQLYKEVDIDQVIPEAVYEPVARLYAEVYAGQAGTVRVGVQS
jgi:flagellar biosynthesis protein FlhB